VLLAATTGTDAPGADIATPAWLWAVLLGLLVVLLLADLFVVNRDVHEISMREAAVSSIVWIAIGLAFGLVVWRVLGGAAATEYYAGYVIEKSLSVDNVFVWAVLLSYFVVPKELQHRVLFWGVFGALVLRAIFIFGGVALLEHLEWVVLIFGAFLIFTGVRVAVHDEDDVDPGRNRVLRLVRRTVPMTTDYRGPHFFTREAGRRLATPLLAVLICVEVTDVIFAVDSIPAILAISHTTFVIFASNAFAILGLRALYFLLASVQDRLVHLNKGLGVILAFVGAKMLAAYWGFEIPTGWSLLFIAVVLTVTVVWSLRSSAPSRAEPAAGDVKPPATHG